MQGPSVSSYRGPGSARFGGRIAGIPVPSSASGLRLSYRRLFFSSWTAPCDRTVTGRAVKRLSERDGRRLHPREPAPGMADHIDEEALARSDVSGEKADRRTSRRRHPDMTRERARTERRDLDKERGEPLAGRGGPRRCGPWWTASARTTARPLGDGESRPRILITNDDGVELRGLLRPETGPQILMATVTVVVLVHEPIVWFGHGEDVHAGHRRVRERDPCRCRGLLRWTGPPDGRRCSGRLPRPDSR